MPIKTDLKMNKTIKINESLLYAPQGLTKDEALIIERCIQQSTNKSRVFEISTDFMSKESLDAAKSKLIGRFINVANSDYKIRWLESAIQSECSITLTFTQFAMDYMKEMSKESCYVQKLQYKKDSSIRLFNFLVTRKRPNDSGTFCHDKMTSCIVLINDIAATLCISTHTNRTLQLIIRAITSSISEINKISDLDISFEKIKSPCVKRYGRNVLSLCFEIRRVATCDEIYTEIDRLLESLDAQKLLYKDLVDSNSEVSELLIPGIEQTEEAVAAFFIELKIRGLAHNKNKYI